MVYEEKDPGFFMDVGGSRLNDFIFIGINDHETTEYRILPANQPDAEPMLVAAREPGVQYDLNEGGDVFFILTNDGGAKDFKIMEAPVASPGKENWREVVPHVSGHADPFRDGVHAIFLSASSAAKGLPRIVIRDRKSGEEHAIALTRKPSRSALAARLNMKRM